MPLPADLRWLDDLLDVLVDEFIERQQMKQVPAAPQPPQEAAV